MSKKYGWVTFVAVVACSANTRIGIDDDLQGVDNSDTATRSSGIAHRCGSAGGITNSAGANVIIKSDGTSGVSSSITDDGTTVATSSKIHSTAIGAFDPDFGQNIAVKLEGPLGMQLTSKGADGFDTQLVMRYIGVNHVGELININNFLQGTVDTTPAPVQAIGVQSAVSTSVGAGSNNLENVAFDASCTGGTNNYSFFGHSGQMRNDGPAAFFDTTVTNFATAGALCDLSASTAIKLNSNVSNFVVPGSSTATASIGLGTSQSDGTQIQTKNTVAASAFAGIDIGLDTTTNSGIRGGVIIYRGAGGGFSSGNSSGMVIAAAPGFPFTTSVANELSIYSELGTPLAFGADTSGFTKGMTLETSSQLRVAKDIQIGSLTSNGGALFTSGDGSPEGVVTAIPGSYYADTTNGEGYIKHTGTGTTGWKLVTHA